MPDGDKEPSVVERIFQLYKKGSTLDQIVELVNEEMGGSDEALRWDASQVSRLLRLHRLSVGDPSVSQTETTLATAVDVRVSTSGQEDAASPEAQEVACAKSAESPGYRFDDADVYTEFGYGGDAHA